MSLCCDVIWCRSLFVLLGALLFSLLMGQCSTLMGCRMMRYWTNSKIGMIGASEVVARTVLIWCDTRQITTLEILAISVGLSTFQKLLRGRKVVVWSDNRGAEGASRKGSAKAFDHCRLVHELWLHALQNQTHVWIERVPSHDNISDSPSRWV